MRRPSTRRSARRGVVTTGLAALAAAHLADGFVARRRLRQLVLVPAQPVAPDGPFQMVAVTAAGVTLDPTTRAAVEAHALAGGLDLVDLLPDDLSAEDTLALLRRAVPESGTRAEAAGAGGATASPGGANHALLLSPALAERMGWEGGDRHGVSVHEMARITRCGQRTAPSAHAVVVAGGLAASTRPEGDWAGLDAAMVVGRPYLSVAAGAVVAQLAHLVALAASVVTNPAAGAAALAAWWAKPAITAAGVGRAVGSGAGRGCWQPHDAGRATARRPLALGAQLVGLARQGRAADRQRAEERRRSGAWPVPDPGRCFESRRETCPWCGSDRLEVRIETTDLLQHKPGRFVLDECRSCGHVFQNPQLTIEGLDFYYDQFYDGVGGEMMTQMFAAGVLDNQRRVAALQAVGVEPRRWLDVGTGQGHFCLAAREAWPETTFDGLDLSDAVEDAARRGWIDGAHRGLFPDLAGELSGYDVITMHHYLEHTRDPLDELDAAAKVLEPGGLLEIEVPDPECPMSRLLGRYWLPWLQPQHLHFVTAGNLVEALEGRSFDVVSVQRDEHQALELLGALAFRLEELMPSGQLPWSPPSSLARQVTRGAVMTAAAPAFVLAVAADKLVARLVPKWGPANIYRVVARKV